MSLVIISTTLPYPFGSYPGAAVVILVFFHGKSMKAAIKIMFTGIRGRITKCG
jgi:hypothetical protein